MTRFGKHVALATSVLMACGVSFAQTEGQTTQQQQQQPQQQQQEMTQQQDKQAHKNIKKHAINFEQGKSELSEQDRQQLREVVQQAKAQGEIQEISVAAWSDQEFPKQGQELSESARNLAEQRIENIENFLEELDAGSVESYSMAERANWLARTFDTDEAELKSQFARQGQTPMTNEAFSAIKQEAGTSKAVVVLQVQPKQEQQQNQ